MNAHAQCSCCESSPQQSRYIRVPGKCNFCDETEGLEWHHIIPRSLGGSDDDFNMLLVCNIHHAILHGMTSRGNIRELTKRGLERAKARGVRLGASKDVIAKASKIGTTVQREAAREFAFSLRPIVEEMQERGLTLRGIADELNARGVDTARGGNWAATTVKNLITKWTPATTANKSPLEAAIRRAIDS
jgi:hypothetical protein